MISTVNKSLDSISVSKSMNVTESKTTNPNLRYVNTKTDKKQDKRYLGASVDYIKVQNQDENAQALNMKKNLKAKTDSRNVHFINSLVERKSVPNLPAITHKKNLDLIEKLNKNAHTDKFYTKEINEDFPKDQEVYIYSSQRKSYFADYIDKLRAKFEKDASHYYTYSKDYLTLSFPYNKNNNVEYELYQENKKKWLTKDGFNRYKSNTKEFVYIPKKSTEF